MMQFTIIDNVLSRRVIVRLDDATFLKNVNLPWPANGVTLLHLLHLLVTRPPVNDDLRTVRKLVKRGVDAIISSEDYISHSSEILYIVRDGVRDPVRTSRDWTRIRGFPDTNAKKKVLEYFWMQPRDGAV